MLRLTVTGNEHGEAGTTFLTSYSARKIFAFSLIAHDIRVCKKKGPCDSREPNFSTLGRGIPRNWQDRFPIRFTPCQKNWMINDLLQHSLLFSPNEHDTDLEFEDAAQQADQQPCDAEQHHERELERASARQESGDNASRALPDRLAPHCPQQL